MAIVPQQNLYYHRRGGYHPPAISNFDLSRTMFVQARRLFCVAFSKATALRVAAPARRERDRPFLFHSFSLGLHGQRKAAKKSWYSKIVPQTIAIAYLSSTFSLGQEPQIKSSQKETAFFRLRGGRHL